MVTVFYEDNGSNKKKKYVLLRSSDSKSYTVFWQISELFNKWELCDEDKTAEIALLAEVCEDDLYTGSSLNEMRQIKYNEGIYPLLDFIYEQLESHLSNISEPLSATLISAKNNQSAICEMLENYKASTDRFASYLIESMDSKAKKSALYSIPKESYEWLASFKEKWDKTFDPSPIKGFDDDNENEK